MIEAFNDFSYNFIENIIFHQMDNVFCKMILYKFPYSNSSDKLVYIKHLVQQRITVQSQSQIIVLSQHYEVAPGRYCGLHD